VEAEADVEDGGRRADAADDDAQALLERLLLVRRQVLGRPARKRGYSV
jgi:hypothetical protein